MELKAGYKQTEVGTIPADWGCHPLSDLGTFSKGQGIRKNEAQSGEIPCIRYGEIYTHHNDVVRVFNSHISLAVAKTSKRIKAGDILFAGSGETKAEIGKAVAFLDDAETYAGGDIVIFSPHDQSPKFLGYLLNTPIAVRQKASRGQGDAVVHISAKALGAVCIPTPPQQEQCAIAEALSDADALIESLDQLITKMRDLKQAAMQQLLTGQTRLPGFCGEWEVAEFGDIATIRNTKVISSSTPTGTQCVELESIGQASGRLLGSFDASGTSSKYSFKRGDVLFGRLRAYLRKYWLAQFDGICSTEIWPLIPRAERIHTGFLHLLVQTNGFIDAAAVSYGTHMPRTDWSVLGKFEVQLPPIPEQTAIATILSDMDTELAELETRLAKARHIKQGMMQELLTGRIRLL